MKDYIELKNKFNVVENELFTYISSLLESIKTKEELIEELTNKLNLTHKELEQLKCEKAERKVPATSVTSQEIVSTVDTLDSVKIISSSVKQIDKYFDVSKLKEGFVLIKKNREKCPICEGDLRRNIIKIACYHKEKIVGYVLVDSLFCGKCQRDYTYYHSINNLIIDIRPLTIKQLSIPNVNKLREEPIKVSSSSKIIAKSTMNSTYEANLNEESALKKLGYQITGTSRIERWDILVNKAIPKLGKQKVNKIINNNIRMRKGQTNGAKKFKNAITEWEHDLRKMKVIQ